ncbi:MAG: dicarboxylate/amino acid:cation symporter [Oscillospiraceae bacterium]|nr:dicarboxylate/amino acid:cation symporter [Oscillospiraceae bacterium]
MKKKISFATVVLIALLLGVAFGFALPDVAKKLSVIGTLFTRALKMVMIPMILFCVTSGITKISSPKAVGKIGLVTLVFALVTNFFSSAAGVATILIADPTKGVSIEGLAPGEAAAAPTFAEIITSIVPDNIFTAFTSNNTLAIVFFSIVFGIAIVLAGEKGKLLADVFDSASEVTSKLIGIVIKFSPVGVFFLMGNTIANYGAGILGAMAKFVLCIWVGTILFIGIWGFIFTTFVAKVPFGKFLSSVKEAFMMGIATCSSAASMPLNIENTEKYLGVPKEVSTMVMSIGTVIVNGGSDVYKAAGAVFLASLYGVKFGFAEAMLVILVTSVLVTAGVPSAGTLTIAVTLTSLGVPVDGIALLLGVDRLRDMISTAGNVYMHSLASVVVNKICEKDTASLKAENSGT